MKNITDFGAFVSIEDAIDGLLHITDMSWARIKHPSELIKVGQELDVMVLDVDRERERVSLGLKQTMPNPWDAIQDQFPVGARVQGKVVNLAAYGAFVEIAPGIEGLVHISEFSWTKRVASARPRRTPGTRSRPASRSARRSRARFATSRRTARSSSSKRASTA